MDITLEKQNDIEGVIKITLKEADYQPKVDQKIKEYGKKANLKGFRPGKVPPAVIKRMYGKGILVEEVQQMLQHALTDYIKEEDLDILFEPVPDKDKMMAIDWDNQAEFSFEYAIGLIDAFDYTLEGLSAKQRNIEVGEKEINETLDNLRNQYAKTTNPDESQEGDMFFGTIKQGDDLEHTLLLEPGKMDEAVYKTFVGKGPGDEVTVQLDTLFANKEDLATSVGKEKEEAESLTGEATFAIKNINRKEPADLDEEFFGKVFPGGSVSNEEELNNAIKEEMDKSYQRETEMLLQQDLRELLVEKFEIALPKDFIMKFLKSTSEKPLSDEEIEKDWDNYVSELKWSIIQNRISKEEGIEVQNEEVEEKTRAMIMQQFAYSGMPPQLMESMDNFVQNYLQGEDGKNYQRMYNEVRGEKLFDLLKEKATIEEESVSFDAFKELASN